MDAGVIVLNRGSSISPFLKAASLARAAGGCHHRGTTAAVRAHSRSARPRKPCLTTGPRAAMRDFEAGGELPETKGSFYELLGVPASGSYGDIKRAYKHLARKYHPDVSPPDRTKEYTQRFIEVKEAQETLSDPVRRALYDRHLACGLQLTFSTQRHIDYKEMEEKSWWQKRWEDQLEDLSRRSMRADSDEELSWGARMRRRRAESAA